MEEYEKSKERLRAMRMEASQAEVPTDAETSAMPGRLSNPLRLDDMNPPVHETESQYSLDHKLYHQQGPYKSFAAHHRSFIRSPSFMHDGYPNTWNGSLSSANYCSPAAPRSPRGTFPRAWNPSNASRYSDSPRHGFSPGDIPYGRSQLQKFSNNSLPDPGQGSNPGAGQGMRRGYSGSFSNRLGRSRGRGWGSHGHSSPSNKMLDPKHLFKESMLEDPWQHLRPVLWRRREAGTGSLAQPVSRLRYEQGQSFRSV